MALSKSDTNQGPGAKSKTGRQMSTIDHWSIQGRQPRGLGAGVRSDPTRYVLESSSAEDVLKLSVWRRRQHDGSCGVKTGRRQPGVIPMSVEDSRWSKAP